MSKKRKPARIHVKLSTVTSLIRGAQRAIQSEAVRWGRSADYCQGAEDAVNEVFQRARVVWGNDFVKQWEFTRPPPGQLPEPI